MATVALRPPLAAPVVRRARAARRRPRRAEAAAERAPTLAAPLRPTSSDVATSLVAHWSQALDAEERAVAASERAKTLTAADSHRFRQRLHEERAWLAHLDADPLR